MVISKNTLIAAVGIILAMGLVLATAGKSPFTIKSVFSSQGSFEKSDLDRLAYPSSGSVSPAEDIRCEDVLKTDNPLLEAYIVSKCPFGLQMQRMLSDAIKNAPELAGQIKVRYIGSVFGDKLNSMHGEAEADENLRQICIRQEYINKYWDYVSCHIQDGDVDGCLVKAGISQSHVGACMQDIRRGLEYAKEDADLTVKYGVKSSPTLIINGQKVSDFNFGGRTSEGVKNIVCCGFNVRPESCLLPMNKSNAATGYSKTYSK